MKRRDKKKKPEALITIMMNIFSPKFDVQRGYSNSKKKITPPKQKKSGSKTKEETHTNTHTHTHTHIICIVIDKSETKLKEKKIC